MTLSRIIHERFCCNRGFAAGHPLLRDCNGSRLACGVAACQRAGSPRATSTYCFKYASAARGSTRGYPLLFSLQRVRRLATPRFRDEPS